ncbi:MAG: hypothetical protein KIH64_015015 [Mycobacterium sp.]|nr:hypothetical protein [Mycobacterium sp.]
MYAATIAHEQTTDGAEFAAVVGASKLPPPVIEMPMITLHWMRSEWVEVHHGALRSRLPLHCQASGQSSRIYPQHLTPTQALIACREANPGCDVQLITTVIQRNHWTLFPRRERRA